MKIFILGTSYSGKTPVAEQLGSLLRLPVYSTGQWARQGFDRSCSSMQDYVSEITEWSLAQLRQDFRAGLTFLRTHYDLSQACIIEGERNPHDFIRLFHPQQDFVVSLVHSHNPVPRTTYELGLDTIWAYLAWLMENGLIQTRQDRRYSFDCLYSSQKLESTWISLEELMDKILEDVVRDLHDPSDIKLWSESQGR
jgi:hypothetical protein